MGLPRFGPMSEAGTSGSYDGVTVEDTPTLIVDASTDRNSVSIYNNGSTVVYVGFDEDVTTANGMPIPPRAERLLKSRLTVYGVVAAGTADVRYLAEHIG